MICPHCGAQLPEEALFCGECGRSLAKPRAVAKAAPAPASPPAKAKGPVVKEPVKAPVVKEPIAKAPPTKTSGGDTTIIELFDEPASEVLKTTSSALSIVEPIAKPPVPWTPPRRLLSGALDMEESEDLDETRLVSTTQGGQRFVLQFSTGESVTTFGTGLVGRNPAGEPSEYFDQLIAIVDPGKSVSKTHLEFGQIAGSFWVSDRYSGNGTVVREPDSQPRRCEPGKRYRVVRGTRVSIGEQFFVVS